MQSENNVLVFLPVLNEAECIAHMIEIIRIEGYEPVISDAGSTDGSRKIAEDLGVRVFVRKSPGKGVGFREMLELARSEEKEILVMLDCDETYPADRISDLVQRIPEYDMVCGARDHKRMALPNRIANWFYAGLITLLYFFRYKDPHTGFRAMKVSALAGLTDADHFDLEPQLACRAIKRSLKILEIPVRYEARSGRSKVTVSDAFKVLWMIIRERFRS